MELWWDFSLYSPLHNLLYKYFSHIYTTYKLSTSFSQPSSLPTFNNKIIDEAQNHFSPKKIEDYHCSKHFMNPTSPPAGNPSVGLVCVYYKCYQVLTAVPGWHRVWNLQCPFCSSDPCPKAVIAGRHSNCFFFFSWRGILF